MKIFINLDIYINLDNGINRSTPFHSKLQSSYWCS